MHRLLSLFDLTIPFSGWYSRSMFWAKCFVLIGQVDLGCEGVRQYAHCRCPDGEVRTTRVMVKISTALIVICLLRGPMCLSSLLVGRALGLPNVAGLSCELGGPGRS